MRIINFALPSSPLASCLYNDYKTNSQGKDWCKIKMQPSVLHLISYILIVSGENSEPIRNVN